MTSSERASRGSCTSVNTVCSDSDRTASLSSSASSASLQDGQSSSSSSLPYGAVPAYPSSPQRNGSDISLDLTPLSQLPAGVNPATAVSLPKLSRLERVVLEIVETEQAYVRDLKSIVEVRKKPSPPIHSPFLSSCPQYSQCVSSLCSGLLLVLV